MSFLQIEQSFEIFGREEIETGSDFQDGLFSKSI